MTLEFPFYFQPIRSHIVIISTRSKFGRMTMLKPSSFASLCMFPIHLISWIWYIIWFWNLMPTSSIPQLINRTAYTWLHLSYRDKDLDLFSSFMLLHDTGGDYLCDIWESLNLCCTNTDPAFSSSNPFWAGVTKVPDSGYSINIGLYDFLDNSRCLCKIYMSKIHEHLFPVNHFIVIENLRSASHNSRESLHS